MNERHRKFLDIYASNGGNGAEAARRVGYTDNGGASIRVTAHRILKKPECVEYLHKLLLEGLTAEAPFAIAAIRHLAEHGTSERVRLEACKELLDRSGFKLAEKHELILRDERSDDEIEAQIRSSLAELGMTEADMLEKLN